ncbi:hypothetical protein [Edaphobacter sp.]|uniref:hypothetical protein n=1 Tax=Edaphobacter sp. TaxID=1934404 RepID=UPI002DBE77DE|nr:hypothetical protein [Edaphobacter sp.]HEU5339702.1 hypothetical protein [Edaphobacter sp.]
MIYYLNSELPKVNQDGQEINRTHKDGVVQKLAAFDQLSIQYKSGWKQGRTTVTQDFVHGSSQPPDVIRASGGISPAFATELIVAAPRAGAKTPYEVLGTMVFCCTENSGGGFAKVLFPKGHKYVFRVPAGMFFYSDNGTMGDNKEIAFPYFIEVADIRDLP